MASSHEPQTGQAISAPVETHQRQTIVISLTVSLVFALVSAVIYLPFRQSTEPNYFAFATPIVISLLSLASALLAWRGHATAGSVFLLATILVTALGTPIIGHGQGVAIGILVAILGIAVSYTALPATLSSRGAVASLLVGAMVILVDQFIPDFGLVSDPIYTQILSAVVTVVFISVIISQFNTFALRVKLALSFAAITIIPLVIIGVYNNYAVTQTLTRQSQSRLTALSETAAQRFDAFIVEQKKEVGTEARQTALVDYLSLPLEDRDNSIEKIKAQNTLLMLLRKDPTFINSYTILDTSGKNLLDTSVEYIGSNENTRIYYTEVIKTSAPFASDVLFIGKAHESIYFSAPIKDAANRIIGILVVQYRATILQKIAREIAPNNPDIIISLVERDTYLRLAYTGDRDQMFKTYKEFSNLQVVAFQSEGRLPPGQPQDILADVSDQISTGIDNLNITPFFDAYSDALHSNTINTGTFLESQPWVALVRESYASNLKAINTQKQNSILISLALAATAILLALVAAQALAAPLIALAQITDEIASGDISARAKINTQDEIGVLAASFNRMADELNETLNSLEARVTERTADLEAAQKQSEKRAIELEAIGEISKVIAGEQKLDILLPLITRLVSERFGFYHTGIFLTDETRQFAILQAANSEGGKRMLARGHRLALGSGIVGYVAQHGIYRIALDVGLDAIFFNNPDLPTTRSEMALPLKVRNQTIGALDVQSEKPGAFSETDAKNLSILADQISVALDNAQLFETTQQALSEAQTLYRKNLQEGWAAFIREEAVIGYHQDMKGGRKLTDPVETDEIRQALSRGSALVFQPDESAQEPSITIPIKLRGQAIGSLSVKAPMKDRQWSNEEINLAETISERLSIAIENARLIQESQRQVIKQQTIGEITEKISTSINLKNVLQVAVEELGRVMPGSEVTLKLTKKDNPTQ